ncbi:MAG TPA: pyridoxamine 5'-phosphate oxidase [Egibacteraceae bacterium]|nr:pyridoxamine 5'-phosphate oxidase [Egibacteraceae bacterium]
MGKERSLAGLDERDLAPDPIGQFAVWFDQAVAHGIVDADAMTLATAAPDGRPSARTVLLKGVDEHGFVFYTNYRSRKARELAANPYAALVFWWPQLQRQVSATGTVTRADPAESDAYFASRSRGSQVGAWASSQSEVLPGRAELDRRFAELAAAYEGVPVPRPPWWGGFRVLPDTVEFWQGRANRLHDRLRYRRARQGWTLQRLAP